MCGIAGIAGLSAVNTDAVRAMTDLMVHRGPDGCGLWSAADRKSCFGHRRLAILDLSERGAQPMTGGDGKFCITYNGELYNYRELRDRLKSLGSIFRGDSDTEVVLEAYRVWGEECLQSFNGMFAFAIHDPVRNVIFCARDRFGEKPLLFISNPRVFAFASEYKALFALEGVAPDIDETRLLNFLDNPAHGFDNQRDSVFRGINQLAAAEYLLLDLDDLSWKTTVYWAPEAGSQDRMSLPEASAELRHLLHDSVRLRLRSDVPVGSCLSGGLDSGSIAMLSRQISGPDDPYHVFTGRFPGSPGDEGEWAARIIAAADLTGHETTPDAAAFLDEIDDFMWLNELPVDSASQYAQWCVFRLAAGSGVTVLLDGQGGDEILAGYEQYFASYLATRRREGDKVDGEERIIRERYPGALALADQQWKHRLPWTVRLALARAANQGSDMAFGVAPGLAGKLVSDRMDVNQSTDLHTVLGRDRMGFLSTLLRYGDRNSMAHSREVRLPFCDHRIAELVAALPPEYLMGGAETKRLLRQAMRGVLPEPVRLRWNKQGFLPPQADWLRNRLYGAAEALFNDPGFGGRGVWYAPWWRRALRRLRDGEDGLAGSIWKPFIDEMWRRHFVDRVRSQPRLPALREGAT